MLEVDVRPDAFAVLFSWISATVIIPIFGSFVVK
jgi:hypothetical protein